MAKKTAPSTRKKPGNGFNAAANLCAELAAHKIEMPQQKHVLGYLDKHHDLAEVVPSVCGKAREEFGDEAELMLEVYRDPEIDDRYLKLRVRLPTYEVGTMARLDGVSAPFDEDLCRVTGYLLVTTDFRTPQAKHAI
jgi:hypothetical protein